MPHAETLRTVGIFASLSDREMAEIGELLEQRKLAKGETVFRQGEVGDALYIVEAGRLKGATQDSSGREKVLAIYGPGDFFGEMALISGQTRSATVATVTDATLLVLRKQAFETFLAANLQVMRQMLAVMAQRQVQANVALVAPTVEAEQPRAPGKIITVFSPKGGVGRTTVAVNLAAALRLMTHRAVALVDCSLPFGDVGVMMNLEPRKSIADLLPSINELDQDILNNVMLTHESGVKVLLAPPSPEIAELITADHAKLLLSKLRELFDYVVIDTLPYLHEVTLAVLDSADQVLVLTTLEMPALKNVKVFLEVTRVLGYDRAKVKLVVNRSNSSGGIRMEDVEATVGHKFFGSVVSDGRLAIQATNRGTPLVLSQADSQIAQDFRTLAQALVAEDQAESIAVEQAGPRHKKGPARLLKVVTGRLEASFGRGAPSPRMSDLLAGLGGVFVAVVAFLFLLSLLGRIIEPITETFPYNEAVNAGLYLIVLLGSFITVRSRLHGSRGGAPLGLAIGVSAGTLIALGDVALALAHLTGGQPSVVLVLIIPGYACLGFLGGLAAQGLRPKLRPLTA